MSAAYRHATDTAMQISVGSFTAQNLIDQIQRGEVTPDHAWLRFWELASAHQVKSAACRAFILELCKRAAA